MMSHCLVRGCRNAAGRTDVSVSFHPFPAKREAAERWASLCGVSNQDRSQLLKDLDHGGAERYHLCSLHFEQEAFEIKPDDKTCGKKLKQGAEPTLLLSPRPTPQSSAQIDSSLPAARSPHGQAPPSASSPCTCARTSRAAQGPDGEKPSSIQLSESRPQVSHCTTGATVVRSQPGVSQIVLNFREEGKSLTLDNVSTESAPQCRGGCHCPQRGVKQVVVIFLDPPRDSATPPSSAASPPTVSSGTQTEARDGKSETNAQVRSESSVHPPSHQEVVHASTQTSTCTETSGPQQNREVQDSPKPEDRSPKTSEVRGSPGEKICPSTALSASILCEPDQQNDATRREADCMPLASSKLPAAPKSLDKEPEHSCGVPTPNEDTRDQQLDDDQTPRNGRKFEPENPSHPPLCPHNQQNAGHFCSDPSINQYVGDLLEQYNVPPPSCIPAPVFSSRCISAQRRVKQIVLNFVEQESASVNQESPAPSTSSNLPSPGVTSLQNQETQTCDDLPQQTPQRANQNPQSWQSTPVRPPRSRSCPPALNIRTLRQEEESSPDHPLPQDTSLEDKVTFEDVAVYFSKEEWELLGDEEKDLYREVMADNYRSLRAVGLLQETPDLVIRMENEEEDLWVDQGSLRRIHHQEEERWCLDRDMDGVRLSAEESDASPCAGRESAESSSHLGALMRLVKEIPGFLLGSSVTDGSSPARSIEDHGNGRQILEVKIEEPSPVSSPASAYVPVSEAVEIAASPGVHRSTEQNNSKIVTKAEKTEVAVSPSSRYSTPVSHPPISSFCMKSDPGTDRLQIKQEEFPAACSPAQQRDIPLVKPNISHLPKIPLYSPGTWDHLIPDHAKRPSSGGGTSLSRSTAASPRNPSVSPASPHQRTKATGLGELKIKQEDSGSERDLSDSPVYGRKVYQTPASSSTVLPAEREPWRMAASPLRSPADAPLGSSPLHRLANCLREITTSRPRPFSGPLSATRWVTDMSRVCAEASGRASASSTMAATQPNPFTAAVTNGAAQLRGVEPKTSDPRASREDAPVSPMRHVPLSPMRHVPLSALGKCLEKIQSRGVTHSSEEPRRAEPGVKRTHSEDLCSRPGAFGGAKRPALEVSSRVVSSCSPGHRDLWRPPEELPRAPTEDQPIGSSHLLSVMNCVRRIPGCRPASSIHVAPDLGRPCTQGVTAEVKDVKVKQERDENPPVETSRQWIAPPQSPDVPKQSGPVASNVHLTGLMRLMEEIPCVESINPSRAMYSIAVGHSMARRMDRSNYLSSCNDDSSFPAELNDGTVASGDSVYSDDTSWSSENVDPSYSAIGGLQRVVSEFAELGSVSPLVAVAAPPGVQDGTGLKKPKEALTASRLNESVRRSPREAAGVAASACSAENGEATIAAIRGLQKVVHGFVEQECVSPITAVRNSTPNSGQRDLPGRKSSQEEEAVSPHILGSPPAPIPSHFLCDSGKWLSERDSSYSALSGLQKVVNGFSEMSCVSPFSAVSTPVSEGVPEVSIQRRRDAQEQDVVSSTPSGQKNVINGVPDAACLSPMTVASNVSSESDAGLTMKSRRETSQKCPTERQRSAAIAVPSRNDSRSSSSSHCIDLTQEEEPVGSKNKTAAPDKERKPKTREGRPLGRPTELPSTRPVHPVGNRPRLPGSSRIPSNQLIDLTEEEETLTKPKALSSEMARKPSHTGVALNPPLAEKHRWSINSPKHPSARLDKPLDPGASGSSRAGSDVRAVPAVNEHLSGLEKLLKGVPTFTPAPRGSGQAWSGSWWFKSTSSHET